MLATSLPSPEDARERTRVESRGTGSSAGRPLGSKSSCMAELHTVAGTGAPKVENEAPSRDCSDGARKKTERRRPRELVPDSDRHASLSWVEPCSGLLGMSARPRANANRGLPRQMYIGGKFGKDVQTNLRRGISGGAATCVLNQIPWWSTEHPRGTSTELCCGTACSQALAAIASPADIRMRMRRIDQLGTPNAR